MAAFVYVGADEWINLDQVVGVERGSDGSLWIYLAAPIGRDIETRIYHLATRENADQFVAKLRQHEA